MQSLFDVIKRKSISKWFDTFLIKKIHFENWSFTFFKAVNLEVQCTLVIVNAWIVNNLSLVNIFGETGWFFYNINYMPNSEHLSLVNNIGDKTEFTITRVHCSSAFSGLSIRSLLAFIWDLFHLCPDVPFKKFQNILDRIKSFQMRKNFINFVVLPQINFGPVHISIFYVPLSPICIE